MYRKKLTYSFFTIPAAVITFRFYDWHRSRMLEKLREAEIRKKTLLQKPKDIQSLYNAEKGTFPWSDLSTFDLNKNFAYLPIELVGEFDHSSEIAVKSLRNGEDGYEVITPFYCYKDSTDVVQPVLVHRGWVHYDYKNDRKHQIGAVGRQKIKGVVYRPEGNKFSKQNDLILNEWVKVDANQIAIANLLPNREVSSKFLIRQVEYNPINKSLMPVVYNLDDVGKYPIPPESNGSCAALFKGLTILNLFTNLFVWVYL
jgi:cytochrome oxidase assembly protein ShyY1